MEDKNTLAEEKLIKELTKNTCYFEEHFCLGCIKKIDYVYKNLKELAKVNLKMVNDDNRNRNISFYIMRQLIDTYRIVKYYKKLPQYTYLEPEFQNTSLGCTNDFEKIISELAEEIDFNHKDINGCTAGYYEFDKIRFKFDGAHAIWLYLDIIKLLKINISITNDEGRCIYDQLKVNFAKGMEEAKEEYYGYLPVHYEIAIQLLNHEMEGINKLYQTQLEETLIE